MPGAPRVGVSAAGDGPAPVAASGAQLGEAEVEDLHEAVARDHHVLGLQVAMDDPGFVGLGQPLGQLHTDVEHVAGGERPLVDHAGGASALHYSP